MDEPDAHLQRAQEELHVVLQGGTRRFALALAVIDVVVGLSHLAAMRGSETLWEIPLAFMSFLAMLWVAHWLRKPRPIRSVHAAGGVAVLLAVATALVHLALSKDLGETVNLILIEVGAGFFLLSQEWFSAATLGVALGWAGVVWTGRTTGNPLHYGTGLGIGVFLGLLLHRVRGKVIDDVIQLQARNFRQEAEQARLVGELQEALENVKTLKGLIPICAQCKKIRDDQGFWNQVEVYVEQRSDASFTHGLCPACLEAAKREFEDFGNF